MPAPSADPNLLEAHQRSLTRYEALVDSSFDDFKLLAAIAAVPAWEPLTSWLGSDGNRTWTLFLGFSGILVVILVLGLRDLLKWGQARVYLAHARALEQQMAAGQPQSHTPALATALERHYLGDHIRLFNYFGGAIGAVLLVVPVAVLLDKNAGPLAGWYAGLAVVAAAIFLLACRHVTKPVTPFEIARA